MPTSHHYQCTVEWTGAAADPTGDPQTFSRDARVAWSGRPAIQASSAPQYQGDPNRVNPEELFISSLALCQMLSYLYLAARKGVRVLAYADAAEGELALKDGKMRMVRVTLHPAITIAKDADPAQALALVEPAHQGCFIANSVSCPVVAEPVIAVED